MNRITACTLDCGDVCSIIADRDAGGRVRFRGNPDHPFTKGLICRKGMRYPETLRRKDRILTPLLRRGKDFEPVSWDAALSLCAEKLDSLRASPSRILHVHSAGYGGVIAQAAGLFFGTIGASGVGGALCDETGTEACLRDFGSILHNDLDDLKNASAIVNWGKDPVRYSIHLADVLRSIRQRGVPLLTVSPGGDGSEAFSDETVRIRPGTDRFLAAAVIRLLLERGQVRPETLERASNADAFRSLIHGRGLDELLAACDAGRDGLEKIHAWYARFEPTATIIGWGVQRHLFGGENVRFINALAFLSGNIGRRGGGSYYNMSSSRNFNKWPVTPPAPRRMFSWHRIGRDILEADPPVAMIWVDGSNLVNQAPDSTATARALERCGFVVAVDAFMTDTALRADLVLPCALIGEREELKGSFLHHYVNYSAKIMDPPGQARSDYDILADLGGRLSPPVGLPARDDLLTHALTHPALDVTLKELRERGFARARHPEIVYEKGFDHADGRFRLVETFHDEPAPDPTYPLKLLSLINGGYLHSQMPEDVQTGLPKVWISDEHPDAALAAEGKACRLVTPLGYLEVRPEVSPGLHPEAVIIRRGGWMKHGWCANPVIEPLETDMGGGTAYYSQKARLDWEDDE